MIPITNDGRGAPPGLVIGVTVPGRPFARVTSGGPTGPEGNVSAEGGASAMGQGNPSPRSYKPSINITQAPGLHAAAPYIVSGYLFLALAFLLVIADTSPFARGSWGAPGVLAAVHCLTLGFLSMTAMGILTQWVPVVFDVPALPTKRVRVQFAAYLIGVVGFVASFGAANRVGVALSGAWLAGAILVFSQGILAQLRRTAKSHDVLYRGVQGAMFGFNAVWLLGLFMALALMGWWPEFQVLRAHIATAVVLWMGLAILTVQQKLNPMFAMSKADGVRPGWPIGLAITGVVLAWLSLLGPSVAFRIGAVAWFSAGVVSLVQFLTTIKQGKAERLDTVFYGVMGAWLLLIAGAALAIFESPLAVIMAFWGMLTLVFSYQLRIVPFMLAVQISKRLPGPVHKAFFMAQAMQSRVGPVAIASIGVVGALLMVVGRITVQPVVTEASAGLGLVMIAGELAALLGAMIKGRGKARGRLEPAPSTRGGQP